MDESINDHASIDYARLWATQVAGQLGNDLQYRDPDHDRWLEEQAAREERDRNERLRLACLEAALRTPEIAGASSDESKVLRAANAYLEFLTAKPLEA